MRGMFAFAAMVAFSLFSVGEAALAAPTKLVFWAFADWTTGSQGDALKAQIAAFEKANPDITIDLEGKPSTDIIAGLVANGNAPGVDAVATQFRASSLVQAGALADLASYFKASPAAFQSQFPKTFIDILTKGGKLLGLPYTTTTAVVYRNLDVLKKAGIDPAQPVKTWADWLAQMQKVKDSGNFAVANQMVFWYETLSYYAGVPGTASFAIVDGKSNLDPAALTKALAFMKATQPFAAPVDSLAQGETDLFTSNKLAFMMTGAWMYPPILAASQTNGFKFDSIGVPGESADKTGGVFDGEFLGVASGSANKDAAWKFISFLADAPQAAAFSAVAGRYVANNVALGMPAVKNNAFIQQQAQLQPSAINDAPFLQPVPDDAPNAFAAGLADLKTGKAPADVAAEIISAYDSALQ
jgi:multiple sugar transport system substrate-binding protein